MAPLWAQADVQNVCTAAVVVILFSALVWNVRSTLVLWVVAWWAAEEMLVAWCSLAYLYRGSPATGPGDQCTGLIGFDLGRIGIFAVACLAALAVRHYRGAES